MRRTVRRLWADADAGASSDAGGRLWASSMIRAPGDRDRLDHEQPQVADDRVGDPRIAYVIAFDIESEAFADEPAAVAEPDVEVELDPVLHADDGRTAAGRRAVHSRAMTERAITTAEILAVGSELLVGETRDTNSGDLALELTALGVDVQRISQLPDRQDVLVGCLRAALDRVDLVITSGGLGPTPDDLTREAIAEALGETPAVDAALESWLRDIWTRRGLPFSDVNLKQAWLIPSASAMPNPHGTAPGWWVDTGSRIVVALPGPPRELDPMWRDHALPRLRARGLGGDRAAETLRLTGIGESAVVDLIGEDILRGEQPQVATYARLDAVDLRVSAAGEDGRPARTIVDETVERLMPLVGGLRVRPRRCGLAGGARGAARRPAARDRRGGHRRPARGVAGHGAVARRGRAGRPRR